MNPIEIRQHILDELRIPIAATDDFTPDVEAYKQLPYDLRLVAENKYVLRDSTRRLVKALDPTCMILYDVRMSEEAGGPMVSCSVCDSTWPDPFVDEWLYCPYCGCRNVVDNPKEDDD